MYNIAIYFIMIYQFNDAFRNQKIISGNNAT